MTTLKSRDNQIALLLTGFSVNFGDHTDDIGKDPAIDTPGKQRRTTGRTTVSNYLASQGVNESLFRIVSRGEHQLMDSNQTDSGRAKYRRDTVVLKW